MPTTKDGVDATQSAVHLDAVRGAAALVVLLGHSRELFFPSLTARQTDTTSSSGQPLSARVSASSGPGITLGNEAVMIFFVLSGYLVGGSAIGAMRRNTWSWGRYLLKRLTRLWVVLIPALALGFALDHAGLHFFHAPGSIYAGPALQLLVPSDLASHLSMRVMAGNAFFLQTILVDPAGTNDSLWSLANEFWYYLAFPVLLLALKRRQGVWVRCAYLLALVGIGVLVGKDIRLLFLVWLLGAGLSAVPLMVHRAAAKVFSVLLAVLLPILFVVVRRAPVSRYEAEWMVALAFTGALYLMLHQTEKARGGIYQKVSGFFSRISYTLYLIHLPLAVFLCACINNPWQRRPITAENLVIFLIFNAVLVLASYLFYLAFEANTDAVRRALSRDTMKEKHLPTQEDVHAAEPD